MAHLKTKAFVLRTVPYGENRRILDLLSSKGEVLTVSGRKSSKMSAINALSQAFVFAEFEIFSHRERMSLDGGNLLYSFSGLQEDFDRMAAASHLAEVFLDALRTHPPMPQAYELWAFSINKINQSDKPLLDVRIAQLRFLSDLGFKPWLFDCSICQRPYQEGSLFSFVQASLICNSQTCRQGILPHQYCRLSSGLIAALRYVIDCSYSALYSFEISDKVQKEFIEFSDLYLEWVMEKKYYRLAFSNDMERFTREVMRARKAQREDREEDEI